MILFFNALLQVLQPDMLLIMALGVAGGIFIGAMPGLTALMGVTLLLPFTYGMEASAGMLVLLSITFGAIYGGSITAILIKTPGTPASAATMLDGGPMADRGEGGRAVGISTVASFFGGFLSALVCTTIAPQLAKVALEFGPSEYFALAVFGLTIIASISGKSLSKGLISGALGLIISTVGMDPISGFPRLTFGITNLYSGFAVVPILIGFFAISNILINIDEQVQSIMVQNKVDRVIPTLKDLKKCLPISINCGLIGTFIGAIPAAGADIGAFVSYDMTKRFSRRSQDFGTGIVEGVAAPEAGNNGVTGGAMIPMLTLGVPGDATTAVLLGALTLQGLQPGPLLFRDHADVVFKIFAGMLVANVIMLILGLLGVRLFIKFVSVKPYLLTPVIFLMCVVGSYALRNNFFDVIITMIAGFIGYFFTKLEIAPSPMVLAIILGPMAESNLRRAFITSHGNLTVFLARPITVALLILAVFSALFPVFLRWKENKKARKEQGLVSP
jgi:putative tricarboxylic transport membrane protein